MLKSVGFKVQVQLTIEKRRQFLPCSTDWKSQEQNLQNFHITGPSPRKRLEFHSNFFTYKKGTLATFFRLLEDFFVTLCEIWEVLYLLITQEFTGVRSTIKRWQNIVSTRRSLLMVIWNFWVKSQSHKQRCLCCCKSKERRSPWIWSLHMVMSISYYMR